MAIAGFDPSLTHLGWVLMDESKTGKDAFIGFGTFITDTSDGLRVQRLIKQRERVKHFLLTNKVGFVSMEAPILEDFSSELLFALNQYLHEVFLNLGIYVLYIQPQSLKKYAVPDMNPNDVGKHHMVHQAKTELQRHGKRFSEHCSDAYFAAKFGLRYHQWLFQKKFRDDELNDYEREQFCGKHTFIKGPKKGQTEYTGIIYRENDQFFDYSKNKRKTAEIIQEVENER